MKYIYVVTMYKIAIVEKHSYVLGVYSNRKVAIKEAIEETQERCGKYSTIILRFKPNNPASKKIVFEFSYNQNKKRINV